MGLTNPEGYINSLASTFYRGESRNSIDMIIAADGNIKHGYSGGKRSLYAVPNETYHPDGNFQGFKKYEVVNDRVDPIPIDDISVYWGEISSKSYGSDEEEVIGEKKIDEKKKKK